ncbi:mutator family transposase [Kineothrix alysoides]|uniref:Mutator family transposase n=1 Tax=Kineothrix alysoides TaxID=1469948 RepID=A0A4R1QXW2_9FIRM|nr:transposase [Kineothrix alysoides]TCL57154.1 mutator family transposase [Kineothrix alysoides]
MAREETRIHYSVRDNGVIKKLAAYVILGISVAGKKEVLSINVGDNESAKYWLSVLNELKTRGVKDILQRSVFPSDTALLKALYLATFEATKKWTLPIRNWGQVYGEMSIMYEGRLPE